MRKKHFFVAGIVVFVLILAGGGYAWYLFHKPHTGVGGISAVAHLGSSDLYNGFQQNETAANKRYLGQVVEVEGTVADVQKTDSTLNIQLDCGSGATGGVSCSVAQAAENKMPVPVKGAVVTVKGRCTGFLMDVNLVDCEIQNIKQ